MATPAETLNSSFTLPCGQVIRNRLVKAAMTEGLAYPDGYANERHANLYRTWANGGSGLLITGNVMVKNDHLERPGNVIIDGEQSEEALAGLKAWAAAAGENGTKIWMQISHSGRQCPVRVNPRPKSSSGVQLDLPGGQFGKPAPLTGDEIEDLIAGLRQHRSGSGRMWLPRRPGPRGPWLSDQPVSQPPRQSPDGRMGWQSREPGPIPSPDRPEDQERGAGRLCCFGQA